MRGRRWARVVAALCSVGLVVAYATPARAQTSGSTWAAIGGGALGLYSGAVLGSMGSWLPCNRTYQSMTCVRTSTVAAGVLGAASGVVIGAVDSETLGDAALGAGIGFAAGAAAGVIMKPFLQRFGWDDVAAVGLMGGAIGASPVGAVIGLGAGTVIGVALWQLVPSIELSDALAFSVGGMALGGLTGWVYRALDVESSQPAPAAHAAIPIGFTLTF